MMEMERGRGMGGGRPQIYEAPERVHHHVDMMMMIIESEPFANR